MKLVEMSISQLENLDLMYDQRIFGIVQNIEKTYNLH
jgi:hypothetical protein